MSMIGVEKHTLFSQCVCFNVPHDKRNRFLRCIVSLWRKNVSAFY